MHLTPREIDKLLLHQAGVLAQKRLARGLRLNYVEAVALLATQILEFIRDGRSVAELMALGRRMLGRRDVLEVRPRGDLRNPLTGVFATRSPDRPNPIGLHRVTVTGVDGGGEGDLRLRVRDLEAIDGTPILDLKPVLAGGR